MRDEQAARPQEVGDLELVRRDHDDLGMLRNESAASASPRLTHTTSGRSLRQSAISASASFVRGAAKVLASKTASEPARACCESPIARALRAALRLTLTAWLRGVGPKTTPPPLNCGARMVPCRARPVPFWRYGFAPPPRTMPRVFEECVP